MSERAKARQLAYTCLDDMIRDPDSDLSILSRQYLRALEKIDRLTAHLQGMRVSTTLAKELEDAWPKSF